MQKVQKHKKIKCVKNFVKRIKNKKHGIWQKTVVDICPIIFLNFDIDVFNPNRRVFLRASRSKKFFRPQA